MKSALKQVNLDSSFTWTNFTNTSSLRGFLEKTLLPYADLLARTLIAITGLLTRTLLPLVDLVEQMELTLISLIERTLLPLMGFLGQYYQK